MSEITIGKTIKSIRENKKISSKNLAAMANITPSMLTQIEKGQANPSINTMKMLAQALDTPLYIFFIEEDEGTSPVVRKGERKTLGYEYIPNAHYEQLMPDGSGMEFCIMTLDGHKPSSSRLLSHTGEECDLVLNGTAVVVFDTCEYELHEGDSIRIPAFQPHRWENRTDEPVRVVFAVGPTVKPIC